MSKFDKLLTLGILGAIIFVGYKLYAFFKGIPLPTLPTLPEITLPTLPSEEQQMQQALGGDLPSSYYVMPSTTPEQAQPSSIIYQPEEYAKALQQTLQQLATNVVYKAPGEQIVGIDVPAVVEETPTLTSETGMQLTQPSVEEQLGIPAGTQYLINPWTGEKSYYIQGTWVSQELIQKYGYQYWASQPPPAPTSGGIEV